MLAARGGHEDERCQVNQYSEADRQNTNEREQREGERMNPGQADEFDNQAKDDQSTGNSQNLVHSEHSNFHWPGLHIFRRSKSP